VPGVTITGPAFSSRARARRDDHGRLVRAVWCPDTVTVRVPASTTTLRDPPGCRACLGLDDPESNFSIASRRPRHGVRDPGVVRTGVRDDVGPRRERAVERQRDIRAVRRPGDRDHTVEGRLDAQGRALDEVAALLQPGGAAAAWSAAAWHERRDHERHVPGHGQREALDPVGLDEHVGRRVRAVDRRGPPGLPDLGARRRRDEVHTDQLVGDLERLDQALAAAHAGDVEARGGRAVADAPEHDRHRLARHERAQGERRRAHRGAVDLDGGAGRLRVELHRRDHRGL
jgi:hypothetical protein